MAFYQLLLFRRGHYKLQVPEKYASQRKHKKNIRKKQKQIEDAKWNIYASLWVLALTGGASSISALISLRNLHVARQKHCVLQGVYLEKYGEEVSEKKQKRVGIMLRLCGCCFAPCCCEFDYDDDDDSDDEKDDTHGKDGKAKKKQGGAASDEHAEADTHATATLSYEDRAEISEVTSRRSA